MHGKVIIMIIKQYVFAEKQFFCNIRKMWSSTQKTHVKTAIRIIIKQARKQDLPESCSSLETNNHQPQIPNQTRPVCMIGLMKDKLFKI